jgi:hypothetical protein
MHSPSVTSATLLPATTATGRGEGGGDTISRAGTTRNAYRVDLSQSYCNKGESSENQWEAEPCLIRFVAGIDIFYWRVYELCNVF